MIDVLATKTFTYNRPNMSVVAKEYSDGSHLVEFNAVLIKGICLSLSLSFDAEQARRWRSHFGIGREA